jgi:integrase
MRPRRNTRKPATWGVSHPHLREDNARQGFFERGDFEAVAAHLPDPVRDIARFAYLSGWRKGEILPLRGDSVDRTAGKVRLRTSKNGRGRLLPLEGALRDLIERRLALRDARRRAAPLGVRIP